jgi:hypothetical protein
MTKQGSTALFAIILCFCTCLIQTDRSFAQEKELTVADVISKHVESIGKPDVIAKVASRGISGKAAFNFAAGASGSNKDGSFMYVSEGKNSALVMKFDDINYTGEYLAFNGKEATVKDMTPGHKSPLADFVFRFNNILKQGYFGGVLSQAWPLLNSKEVRAQEYTYKLERLKDRDFHVLERAIGDIKVRLFFDTKTFHHVRTEYKVNFKNDISSLKEIRGEPEVASSANADTSSMRSLPALTPGATIHEDQPNTHFTLVEKFDKFADVRGLQLPAVYGIEFSAEGHGTSFVGEWSVMAQTWLYGKTVDQNFFIAK